jgi:hypothetical protein
VSAAERPEVRAERRAGSFAGVAVDLAVAVPIIVSRPLVHAVADGGVGRIGAPVTPPFVGIEDRAVLRNILGNQSRASTLIRMIADP